MYTVSHFDLIRRKGVYPYDYMQSAARFDEEELPPQEAFYNKLSGNSCSDIESLDVKPWMIITMFIYSFVIS